VGLDVIDPTGSIRDHPVTDSIRILCPNLKCRALLAVPTAARGKSVRCRSCGTRVRIPATVPTVEGKPVEVEESTGAGEKSRSTDRP